MTAIRYETVFLRKKTTITEQMKMKKDVDVMNRMRGRYQNEYHEQHDGSTKGTQLIYQCAELLSCQCRFTAINPLNC